MQREAAAGQGYTPKADKLDESIILKLSPLLTFEGDSVDASIDLTVNTVRTFHRTKVIAPRESGPPEMSIDVPEVSQTHLDQTVKNWPLGQTLLVTGGIHPGILDKKGGWLGTPIGAPSEHRGPRLPRRRDGGPRQAQGDGVDDPGPGRRARTPRTTRRSTPPAIPRPAPRRAGGRPAAPTSIPSRGN